MNEKSESEQLEEGEIVDDELEDISDNSITELSLGKFITTSFTNLHALSWTSDSDIDKVKSLRHKRKLLHRKYKRRKRKKVEKVQVKNETSDSESLSGDLKVKLKEAIHISGAENQKNTLEKRLKVGGLVAPTNEPEVVDTCDKPVLKETDTSDKIDDTELENLRLEALKTAVLNKCQRRKRKKLEEETNAAPLENKENNTPLVEQLEINKISNDIDEDEDILRASLLAGLAQKIAKKQVATDIEVKKLPVKVIPVLPKRIINKVKNISKPINKILINKKQIKPINLPKPKVKPLIIKVNADSDSDDDIIKQTLVPVLQEQAKPPPTQKIPELNVDKFLKEQRAKFETDRKKFQLINQKNNNKSVLEKSAVKLLPKSQQLEYQVLLRKIKNAERRKMAKKKAATPVAAPLKACHVPERGTNCVEIATVSNLNSVNNNATVDKDSPPKEADISEGSCDLNKSSQESVTSETKKLSVTSELTILKKTLKDIKMQRNGSLQIKSKYQMLTPIIRKITATSNDRKKQEHRIKTLLQELHVARNFLSKSHERFSLLVTELVDKKEKIDKSYEAKVENKKLVEGDMPKNGACKKGREQRAPVTSTPIKMQPEVDEAAYSTLVSSSTNNECEDMDICNSDETDVCQIDIVDPNDIDQIFKRRPQITSTVPEYVSPLNHNLYGNVDPLGIMCPYEVDGSCRDVDCGYKHFIKSGGRL